MMNTNKRFGLLVMFLCLTLVTLMASGVPEVTKQKMIEANSNENLLQKSDRLLFKEDYNNTDLVSYRTKDFWGITSDSVYYEGYLDGRFYCYNGEYYYGALLCYDISFDPLEDCFVFDVEATACELTTGMEIDGDKILLKTSFPPDTVPETLDEYGLEYEEGDYVSCSYVLDAESLLLYESSTYIRRADGTVAARSIYTLTLDAEMPEIIEGLYNRLMIPNQQEVTIVLNPGTETEEIFKGYFVEGEEIHIYLPDGYTELYTDAACTELYGKGESFRFVNVNVPGTYYSKCE